MILGCRLAVVRKPGGRGGVESVGERLLVKGKDEGEEITIRILVRWGVWDNFAMSRTHR